MVEPGTVLVGLATLALLLLLAAVAAMRRLRGLASTQASACAEKPWLLLVTAHPDDESMFFVPALRAYKPERTFVLCLSNGGFDGLGPARASELLACCNTCFGIPLANVDVLDDALLRDGPQSSWPAAHVASLVRGKVAALVARQCSAQVAIPALDVLTFDESGVSGHANHVAAYRGVLLAAAAHNHEGDCDGGGFNEVSAVRFWKLGTRGVLRKYAGMLPVLVGARAPAVLAVNPSMRLSYDAMAAHATQFVWYRKLFVIFSSYTFCNVLSPIIVGSPQAT